MRSRARTFITERAIPADEGSGRPLGGKAGRKKGKSDVDDAVLFLASFSGGAVASFMRYLWKRYADNPAVVPAAYNAGHGAADRWLRERADQPLDEWIENIPYDETRRYTRRVLQSYGVYAMLEEGRLPAMRALLPTPRTN
jgi:soluble lytic murein transglycosylase